MEQAFALPRSVMLRAYVRGGIFLFCYYVFVVQFRPARPLSDVLSPFTITLIIFCLGFYWWAGWYKYVRLSDTGFRGCPFGSFKIQSIAWTEPVLVEKTTKLNLNGHTFISRLTGSQVFIPLAILRSQAFQQTVERQAPPEHALRTTKF